MDKLRLLLFLTCVIGCKSTMVVAQVDADTSVSVVPKWTAFIERKINLPVRPVYITGTTRLEGTTNPGYGIGYLRNIPITDKIYFTTGIEGGVNTINELYGFQNEAGIPPSVNTEPEILREFETAHIGVPFQLLVDQDVSANLSLNFSAQSKVNFYLPMENLVSGSFISPYGRVAFFDIDFKDAGSDGYALFSKPKLDHLFQIGAARKLKNNEVGLSLGYGIGTKNVDETSFIVFPDNPDLETTGRSDYNRNHFNGRLWFSYGSNKKRK